MKIFYAVQATGNGHISRAMELLPWLQQYGEVDIFLSGNNSHLNLDAPVKYRSKGISLYYDCKGGLDYWQLVRGIRFMQIREEIKQLPVEKYDLILNDFDYITSAACIRKQVPSIHFGHQASFQSPLTPRPIKKNGVGEWLLKNYIKATHHVGLHFSSYDDYIFGPIIKKEILQAIPADNGHITVYLPSYCETQLISIFTAIKGYRFEIFSRESNTVWEINNIRFFPVNRPFFDKSLINCRGIITGGGFETPSEALHLGKRLMVIPIQGQYEQQCNAEALKGMGVTCLSGIKENFHSQFIRWISLPPPTRQDYSGTIPKCLQYLNKLDISHIDVLLPEKVR